MYMVFLYSAAYFFVYVCICFPPRAYEAWTTGSGMLIGTLLVGVAVQATGISPQRENLQVLSQVMLMFRSSVPFSVLK